MISVRSFFILLILSVLLAGCSVPRVIVLNDPLDARGHNDLGASYEARGEADLALREYERAAELDPAWGRPLVNRANVLAARGDWAGAAESLRGALRREPGNAEAMNNLAWVLLKSGAPDRAVSWAEEAVALAPSEPAYLDTLAEIRIARGERQAAALLVDRALALSPPHDLKKSLQEKKRRLSAGRSR